MLRYNFLVIFVLIVNVCFAQSNLSKIDSILRASSELHPEVGISVGFLDDTEDHYFNFGYSSRLGERKVSQESIFEIGSITKLLTSYLIAKQVAAGDMSLYTFIDNYLPTDLKLNPAIRDQVKVRDLASHQSGLPDFNFTKLLATNPEQPLDEVSREMVDSILASTSNLALHGSYQYSNMSYVLLGYIIQKMYGDTYENILKRDILLPFKMTETLVSDFSKSDLARGYSFQGVESQVFNWNEIIAPAGLVKSNSKDMLKFIRELLDDDNKAITSILETTQFKNTFIEVGLGVNIIRKNASVVFAKSGDTLGQSCVLAYCPEKKWGLIILSNQASGLARDIFSQIAESLD